MKLKYYLWLYLAASILLTACVRNSVDDSAPENGKTDFTVREAQEFFENQAAMAAGRAEDSDVKPRGLIPGDFTPCWDQAKTSQNDNVASVDVPIISTYNYRAIRCETTGNRVRAYEVKIDQKLVITKNKSNHKLGQYIMSIIPDRDYYQNNKNQLLDKILSYGDKGNLNGIIIFSNPYTGIALGVTKFKNGKSIAYARIASNEKSKMKIRLAKATQILGAIKIMRGTSSLLSRSWGEDDFGGCPWCGDPSCGGDCNSLWYCGYCGGMGCAGCNGVGEDWYNCLICFDHGCEACDFGSDNNYPDPDPDPGLGFSATCPVCKKYTWTWSVDEDIPNSDTCPLCGAEVIFSGI